MKDPEERIQSAHDVKLQLQWILGGDAASPERARPFARWTVLIVIAAVLMLVIGHEHKPYAFVPGEKAPSLEGKVMAPPGMAKGFSDAPAQVRVPGP